MVSQGKMFMTGKMNFIAALAVASMLAGGVLAAAQEQNAPNDEGKKLETLLVQAQKICPVSGKSLTSMGGPVKATTADQTVYLCCKGCLQRDIGKRHWNQIQANLIAAQGKCPVMGKPLPKDPKSVVVKGRRVFVCCPPCTNKVAADADKYLAVVDTFLKENLGR